MDNPNTTGIVYTWLVKMFGSDVIAKNHLNLAEFSAAVSD